MQHAHTVKTLSAGALLAALVFTGASCSSKVDGGVFLSSDLAETWEQRVFVSQEKKNTITIDALNIENIFFDPQNGDIVYLASKDSGLFKSTNAGEQWAQLSVSRERIRDVGINAVNTNELYATVGTTIVKSVDAGENWETIYTDPRAATVLRVKPDWFDPARVYATTSTGNVILSVDSGVNWTTALEVDEPMTDLVIDPDDSRIVYAVELDKNIYKSTDAGLSWTPLITEDTEWSEVSGIGSGDVTASDPKIKKPSAFKTLVIDPNNHDHIYFTSPQGISSSLDGGLTWAYLDILIAQGAVENANIKSFMILPGNENAFFFSLGRIIHKSIDGGKTWKTIENFPSGRNITALAASPKAPDRIFAGTEVLPKKKGMFGF